MSRVETLPSLSIRCDGRTLSKAMAGSLSSVHVISALSAPTVCELSFEIVSPLLLEQSLPTAGETLVVNVDVDDLLFDGVITGVQCQHGSDGSVILRLRGFDALYRLRKRSQVRAIAESTITELADLLLDDAGLALDAEHEGEVTRWSRLVQWQQSDLEFLRDVAERSGHYFVNDGQRLRFVTLAGFGDPIALAKGDNLLEADFDASAETVSDSVQVLGWHPVDAEAVSAVSESARTSRQTNVIGPSAVGGSHGLSMTGATVRSVGQAGAHAAAALDRRIHASVVARGVARGDTRLGPGSVIDINGVLPEFEGRYAISQVEHLIDRERGFQTEFTTRAPDKRERALGSAVTLGTVIDLDDPEHRGRVRLCLPAYAGIETDWWSVMKPGAGADKGVIATPNIDDRVVVCLPDGGPEHGIVLGGLHGANMSFDSGVDGGSVQRFVFTTPAGQRLTLDDANQRTLLETEDGNSLEMTPRRVRLKDSRGNRVEMTSGALRLRASRRLEIEAPGKPVVIRGSQIDFEKA